MDIPQMLNMIVTYTSRVDPHVERHLQLGLAIEQILERAPLPYALPQDVCTLYQWHNGIQQHADIPEEPLFYYHTFLSIENAFEVYQWRMHFNMDEGSEVFDPRLFPLFTFQGEYYMTWCADEIQPRSPIFFDYHGCGQVYDNLECMLAALVECYESGAYYIHNNEYRVDERRVAQIKAYWNACRHQKDGTTLRAHP